MTKLTPEAEQALAEMRASARVRAPLMRKPKPPLVLPPDCVDVTDQHAGETLALVGVMAARSLKDEPEEPGAIEPSPP